MISTRKRAKCLSGSHSSTDGGRRYAVSRSIVRKLSNGVHPATKKGRINAPILPKLARCAKSDRLLATPVRRAAGGRAFIDGFRFVKARWSGWSGPVVADPAG